MISLNKQLRLAAGLGLVGMALISAVPAAAAPSTDCGGVNDTLSFVASSVPLTLTGGTHTGTGEITLTCNSTPISGAAISISVEPRSLSENFSINGVADSGCAATSASPTGFRCGAVSIGSTGANGKVTFTVESTTADLSIFADAHGVVAKAFEDVTNIPGNDLTRIIGLAPTPELDSIALFGTGAMGMAGYALMRMRAARGRREES